MVADVDGNVIAITQTLSTWGGSFYVSRGLGFLYNNHLRSNRTAPGSYGQLKPLTRSNTANVPMLVFKERGGTLTPRLAVASAGNAWIPASTYSIITGVIDGGMSMQQAIEAPRFLVTRDPGDVGGRGARVEIEDRFPRAIVQELMSRGHRFQKIGRKGELRYGFASGVLIDEEHGQVEGGADPRRSHAAVAVEPVVDVGSGSLREIFHPGDRPRLPQMPPFVSGHRCESRPQRNADPRRKWRSHAGPCEVDPIGLPQPVDVLNLVRAESCQRLTLGPLWTGLSVDTGTHAEPDRRFHEASDETAEEVVAKRPLRVRAVPDGVRDAFVDCRQIRSGGRVHVLEALGDRPGRRAGLPRRTARRRAAPRVLSASAEICSNCRRNSSTSGASARGP